MTKQEFRKWRRGDLAEPRQHGEGTLEEKITSDTKAATRTVRASKDDPQYRVRSDTSGNDAVHKPEALKKMSN